MPNKSFIDHPNDTAGVAPIMVPCPYCGGTDRQTSHAPEGCSAPLPPPVDRPLFCRDDEDPAEFQKLVDKASAESDAELAAERAPSPPRVDVEGLAGRLEKGQRLREPWQQGVNVQFRAIDDETIRGAAATLRQLSGERDAALREVVKHARELGEMQGKYEAAHWPGVVDDWRAKAEAAEARVGVLEGAIRGLTPSHRRPGCWCELSRDTKRFGHEPRCSAARAALPPVRQEGE